jgi:hypothetical protein
LPISHLTQGQFSVFVMRCKNAATPWPVARQDWIANGKELDGAIAQKATARLECGALAGNASAGGLAMATGSRDG